MAQTAEALSQSFKDNNVLRIAIVDDGYDLPETTAIDEQRWLALRAAVDDADGKLGLHAEFFKAFGELPSYGDLRNEHIHNLWVYHSGLVLDENSVRDAADLIGKALENVFRSFAGRKIQKLRQLQYVESAARDATGQEPARMQSGASANELKDFDLVFLDFFLGDEVDSAGSVSQDMLAHAQENASRMVREISAAALPKAAPLFVVISSLATNDNVPQFRDNAELLGSKFRFLSKADIEKDPAKRDFVLRSLVSQRAAGDAVELLAASWKVSINQAIEDMMKSIRRLDIADYAYIQTYRLTEEKVSLLNYLTWLYNAYLGSFVEERLAKTSAEVTKPLADFTKPSAILRPMSEIPRIYSRITTTKTKDFSDGETPKIWTGDLFVRKSVLSKYTLNSDAPEPVPDESAAPAASSDPSAEAAPLDCSKGGDVVNQSSISQLTSAGPATADALIPQVVAAITPVCDLVPGRIKAKTVMLIGGELTELGKAKEASNHLLVYDRPGTTDSPVEFQIKWDSKWPLSFPIADFDGEGVAGTDYVRVTRLRELYAAEIAQTMASDLARVGVPVAPPFTRPLDVQVRIVGKKAPVLSTIGVQQRPYAWDLHRKKSGPSKEIVFSEDFLWDLRAIIQESCAAGDPCRVVVEDISNLEGLTTPFATTEKYPTNAKTRILIRHETVLPDKVQKPVNQELIVISLFDISETS